MTDQYDWSQPGPPRISQENSWPDQAAAPDQAQLNTEFIEARTAVLRYALAYANLEPKALVASAELARWSQYRRPGWYVESLIMDGYLLVQLSDDGEISLAVATSAYFEPTGPPFHISRAHATYPGVIEIVTLQRAHDYKVNSHYDRQAQSQATTAPESWTIPSAPPPN